MRRLFVPGDAVWNRNTNGGLVPVSNLFAAIEGVAGAFGKMAPAPEEDRGELLYSPVLALQSYTSKSGEPQVRAWLSGQRPIASDHFDELTNRYFINHYRFGLPEASRMFIYA